MPCLILIAKCYIETVVSRESGCDAAVQSSIVSFYSILALLSAINFVLLLYNIVVTSSHVTV